MPFAAAAAAASIGGALISSGASQGAANTQAAAAQQASNNALAEQQQTNQNLLPFRLAGQQGVNDFAASIGQGGGGNNLLAANGINSLTFQPTQAQLAATPGYQFDLNQGLQSVQNSNAASGRGISGAALKGAAQYATGLANNTLTTQQGIFQQNLGNVLNPLEWESNLGQNSAATQGQQGVQSTQNANALQVGGANALASGQVGSANAISGGLSSAANAPLNYALYNNLLGGGGGLSGSGSSGIDTTSPF